MKRTIGNIVWIKDDNFSGHSHWHSEDKLLHIYWTCLSRLGRWELYVYDYNHKQTSCIGEYETFTIACNEAKKAFEEYINDCRESAQTLENIFYNRKAL